MTVWSHLPTIFNQRYVLRFAGLTALCVALITTLLFAVSSSAAPGINKTISFQGRLLDSSGEVVPDGYYNVQFKIYQNGTGTAVGNPGGTLEWTETYINDGSPTGAVQVVNGFLSVNLGSITPFGTSVDWNQDTLWLSMNVAGTSASCTTFDDGTCEADGEMLPMKRLTASPYAMNAGQLGGIDADGFIQNRTTQQTGNFNISGTGIAGTVQGNTSVLAPLFDRADLGTLTIGSVNASTIEVGSPDTDQTVNIATGTGNKTVAIGSASGSSSVAISGGSAGVSVTTAGDFTIYSDGADRDVLAIDTSGNVGINLTATSLFAINDSNNQPLVVVQEDDETGRSLSVTGNINASNALRINGENALSSTSLNFSGSSTSTVSSAAGQTLQLASDTGVRIGDGVATGEPTLLTVDRSSTTPTATGDAILGSMYYDTTLGKIQCYEADGWGACSSSPDSFVTISPEYTNAVTNGSGIGTMSSDLCSDTLNINDGSSAQPTVCGTNETYNYYNWTSDELTAQTKSIYVTYQLPANFEEFIAGSTFVTGRTDSSNASVSYQVYKNSSAGLVACGTSQSVSTGTQSLWQKVSASGSADPSNCTFTAGESVVIKIDLTASDGANAYASTLGFAFSDD